MKQKSYQADPEIVQAAQTIWDYMKLNQPLKSADLLFVLGSRDDRVADYAAMLYKMKLAPRILISGGNAHTNDLLRTHWQEKSEAEHFANVMKAAGVPDSCLLIESQATNTGQNIMFGYEILKKAELHPRSMVLIQKPYMERRTYATFAKQ